MTFRLAPGGFGEVRRTLAVRMMIIMPLVCCVSLYIAGGSYRDWFSYIVLLFFSLVGYYSYRTSLVRQKAYWDTYEIRVDERTIERRMGGYVPYILQRAEITTLELGRGGDLEIVAGGRRLTVPRHLVDFETLVGLLEVKGKSGGVEDVL